MLIAALSVSFLTGIEQNSNVPQQVKSQVSVNLAGNVPFISESDARELMAEAGVSEDVINEVVDQNEASQIDGCAPRSRCWPSWARSLCSLHSG